MTGPNMSTITASLERALQNCSLNHHQYYQSSSSSNSSNTTHRGGGGGGISRTSSSDMKDNQLQNEPTLELNSNVSMPYHWEQCLDLKTGEVYYINWRTGMKAKEDPRVGAELSGPEVYSEDDCSYDSEGSSTESSSSSSRVDQQYKNINVNLNVNERCNERDNVLVVTGCKTCLMYFMVPKQVEDCPKCCGQLLHFDRSENGSP